MILFPISAFESISKGVITFLQSADGVRWDSYSFDSGCTNATASQLFFVNDQFVLLLLLSTGYYAVYTSVGGRDWEKAGMFDKNAAGITDFEMLYYGAGKYISISHEENTYSNTHMIMYSTDLVTWKKGQGASSNLTPVRSIAYGKGRFIICTNVGSHRYSVDGANWVFGDNVDNGQLTHCIFTDRFIAIGKERNIYVSADAVSWEQISVCPFQRLSKIMYTG